MPTAKQLHEGDSSSYTKKTIENPPFFGFMILIMIWITGSGLVSTTRLRNDLYCVEWDVKLYYTIPYHTNSVNILISSSRPTGHKHRLVGWCSTALSAELSCDSWLNWHISLGAEKTRNYNTNNLTHTLTWSLSRYLLDLLGVSSEESF